jgi:hypothetical protein
VPDDPILTARLSAAGLAWSAHPVQYIATIPDSIDATPMIEIACAGGARLAVSPDQLLLVAGAGKLKRADHLVAGSDRLVAENGAEVAIAGIETVEVDGPHVNIAAGRLGYDEYAGGIDNHLIAAGGLVVGDYVLQLFQATAKMHDHLIRRAPN